MTKTEKKIAIWAGATALWYFILRGANALRIKMVGWSITGLDLLNRTVTVLPVLRIYNPLWISTFVRTIRGELYIMNAKVADVNAMVNRPIVASAATDITVPVQADLNGLGEAVIQNINTGDIRSLMITFVGSVEVGKNNSISLPVKIGLSWEDIR